MKWPVLEPATSYTTLLQCCYSGVENHCRYCVEEEHELTRPLITPDDEHRPAESDVPQHQQPEDEDVGRGDSDTTTDEAGGGLSLQQYLDQVLQKLGELCPQDPQAIRDYQRALYNYQRSLFITEYAVE